jgi:hypothetical protein
MTLRLFYSRLSAIPFQALEFFLSDQRVVRLENPELASFAEDGETLVVFIPPETVEFINPTNIVSVRTREPAS